MFINVNAAYPTLNTEWWFIRSLCQLAGDCSVSLAAPSIKSFCVCKMYDREAWERVKTHDGRHSSRRFSCDRRHVFRQWLRSNGFGFRGEKQKKQAEEQHETGGNTTGRLLNNDLCNRMADCVRRILRRWLWTRACFHASGPSQLQRITAHGFYWSLAKLTVTYKVRIRHVNHPLASCLHDTLPVFCL